MLNIPSSFRLSLPLFVALDYSMTFIGLESKLGHEVPKVVVDLLIVPCRTVYCIEGVSATEILLSRWWPDWVSWFAESIIKIKLNIFYIDVLNWMITLTESQSQLS